MVEPKPPVVPEPERQPGGLTLPKAALAAVIAVAIGLVVYAFSSRIGHGSRRDA